MSLINNSTYKFVIHDINGQPQMIKVLRNYSIDYSTRKNTGKLIRIPITELKEKAVYQTLNVKNLNYNTATEPKVIPLPVEKLSHIQKISFKTEFIEDYTEEIPFDCSQELNENQREPTSVLKSHQNSSQTQLLSVNSVMSYTTRRRPNSDNDAQPEYTTKRRKHADKVGKGLRHFSMKVCEKVRTKGFTSYNEVADELVTEFAAGMHGSAESQQYDQKNIRRRVYDALNVLMAMNIISKEKKEIRWLGLPTNSIQECTALEKEKQAKIERIQKKTQQLQELILQHISFKSLIERNKKAENKGVKPSPSSAIHLPFIVVNTSDKALIDCSISNDKTEYVFNFNKKFQIHDDIDILKRMGLLHGLDKGECTEEDLERIKSMVPKSLENYVELMGRGSDLNMTEDLDEDEDVEEESEAEDDIGSIVKIEPDGEDEDEPSSSEDGSDVDV